ncbi:MAG: TIGR01777 family protein [Acidimicrobiia bacterium]|nr:TIGR01777 family protein [Acidimicrobiia bacterium]
MRIVVAGGTGFLGAPLVRCLRAEGHLVTVLTRRPHGAGQVGWNPATIAGPWALAVEAADAVINLSGESIAGARWTRSRKAALRASRLDATRGLVAAMTQGSRTPAVFLNASAVGIYGPHDDEEVTEATPPGDDFLSSLAQEWEAAALAAATSSRVVLLRTGIVLDREGGALAEMAMPFSFMAGGPLGTGRQWMPWIHRDDWIAMVTWALTTAAVSGPLNLTAPNPVTNREFAQTLGRALRRPSFMPAPAFALRLVLGEMATMILTGQRVLPAKALALGFQFQHPTLAQALQAIYARRSRVQ